MHGSVLGRAYVCGILGSEAGVWQRELPYAGFVAQAVWQYQESARVALLTAQIM